MLLLTASAIALSTAASADRPVILDPTNVVTITGRRQDRFGTNTPVTVTVIDRDQIDLEAVTTLSDLLTTVPGVQAVQAGPAGSLTSVFIRGANSKHTLALYDGIRINDASSATGVFNFGSDTLGDVSRVEIVRGPLSSIYGSDAIGGVINILPRYYQGPGMKPHGSFEIGELETFRANAGIGYGEEAWNFNLSAEQMTSEGYDVTPARISTADGDPDGTESRTVTARGEAYITDDVALTALYRWRESEVDFDTFSGGPSGFQRADDPDLESQDELQITAIGLRYEGLQLYAQTRYGRVSSALDSFNGGALTDTYDSDRDFLEARVSYSNAGWADSTLTAGIDWQDESIETDTAFNNPLSVSEDVTSVYLVSQVELNSFLEPIFYPGPILPEEINLTASIRHDDYEAFGGQTTANIGAIWMLDQLNTRFRVGWGTSFKAPTLSERFASSAFVTPNPDLVPEEGESFEIGFHTNFALGNDPYGILIGGTWYTGEIENLIENVFDFTTFTGTNQNIGKADLSGFELYGAISPIEGLTARLDYSNTDATNAATGTTLLRRPEHAVTANVTWETTERLTLNTRFTHTGERLDVTYDNDGFFVSSSGEVDSYQLVDVSAQYELDNDVKLFARVSNLFDETYEQPAAFAGAPRTVSVGIRWRP